jgi:hypothetical protein
MVAAMQKVHDELATYAASGVLRPPVRAIAATSYSHAAEPVACRHVLLACAWGAC